MKDGLALPDGVTAPLLLHTLLVAAGRIEHAGEGEASPTHERSDAWARLVPLEAQQRARAASIRVEALPAAAAASAAAPQRGVGARRHTEHADRA